MAIEEDIKQATALGEVPAPSGWFTEGSDLSVNADKGRIIFLEDKGWLRVTIGIGKGEGNQIVGARTVLIESADGSNLNAEAQRAFPLGAWREQFNAYRMNLLNASFEDRALGILRRVTPPDDMAWRRRQLSILERSIREPAGGEDAEEKMQWLTASIDMPLVESESKLVLELIKDYEATCQQHEWSKVMVRSAPLGRPKRGHKANTEFYQRFAARYSDEANYSRTPVKNIASAEGVPIKTARTWLSKTRNLGLLPPGTDDDQ